MVVGSHPHWVQGIESVGDSLVVYSLGNFVFDMDFTRETQEGAALELTFWGSDLKNARLVPVVIGSDFAPRVRGRAARPSDPGPGVGRQRATIARYARALIVLVVRTGAAIPRPRRRRGRAVPG